MMSLQAEPHQCDQCSYFTTRLHHLIRHRYTHGENFLCDSCQGCFNTINGLRCHSKFCKDGVYIESHRSTSGIKSKKETNDQNLKRSSGSEKDPEKEELERNLLEILKSITEDINMDELLVELPESQFNDETPLYDKLTPSNSESFTCNLRRNLETHEDLYYCSKCEISFSTLKALNHHFKTHGQIIAIKIESPIEIKKENVEIKRERFCCPHCDKTFSVWRNLRRHQVCHSEHRRYKCSYCPRTFKHANSIKYHHRSHIDSITKAKFSKVNNETIFKKVNQKISQANELAARIRSKIKSKEVQRKISKLESKDVKKIQGRFETANDFFEPDEEFYELLEEVKQETSIVAEEF